MFPDALRVHEDHVLLAADEEPKYEIGVEVACLEEAHAASLAEIAEQVEFLVGEETAGVVVERLEILDE